MFDLSNTFTSAANGPEGTLDYKTKSLGKFRLLLVKQTREREEVEEKTAIALSL